MLMKTMINKIWGAIAVLAVLSSSTLYAQPKFSQEILIDGDGFVSIFDGKTLDDWKGDPNYWHVENACLVGTVTPETILENNTFIVWQGGQPEDFELKLEYRISDSGNSGINYRSTYLEGRPYA